jgi:polysaccharide export outer membrane protein
MWMRSRNAGFGSFLAVFILAPLIVPAMAHDPAAPKELIQFVRDAKKAGLKESQAKWNAMRAGWPDAAVADAVAYIYGAPKRDVNPHLAATAEPITEPPTERKTELPPAATAELATSTAPPAMPAPAPNVATATATGLPKGSDKSAPKTAASAKRHPAVDRGVPYDYQIGAGDILQVSVWKEPDASSPNVVVRPDGKISMPLLKEVQVVGLTPIEAEALITQRLDKVIDDPDVTVIVTGINSKKIYAVGAVKKEGPIAFTYRMSVMQAISEAGGLTDYAKRKKIYVLRNENGKETRLPFDYNAVLKGQHMESNIQLLPNDTLVVPH